MKKNMKKHSFIKRTVCIILIIGCIITGVYSYYRVWASPAELYDAMIYVSGAHPIEVIKD